MVSPAELLRSYSAHCPGSCKQKNLAQRINPNSQPTIDQIRAYFLGPHNQEAYEKRTLASIIHMAIPYTLSDNYLKVIEPFYNLPIVLKTIPLHKRLKTHLHKNGFRRGLVAIFHNGFFVDYTTLDEIKKYLPNHENPGVWQPSP